MTFRAMMMSAAAAFALGCGSGRPMADAGCFGITCVGGGTGGAGGGSASGGGTATGGGAATGGGSTTGGGTGGGSATGGGSGSSFGWDGGTTIDAVRGARFCSERVRVDNVVVVGVESATQGGQGDYNTQFWVVDQGNPMKGMFVDKFFTDLPGTYRPTLGDVLNLEGFVKRTSANVDRKAYRVVFGSTFGCSSNTDAGAGVATNLEITLVSQGATVPSNSTTSGFGNAMNGSSRPNPEYGGTRVSIPGPLTLTNPAPTAFKRISQRTDDNVYLGFEVSGGILVNNIATFDRYFSDGGSLIRCDWRAYAVDAGSNGQTVVFPNGISGVWDTYSHAPCRDGGTGCSDGFFNRDSGVIPGTGNDFTYVLYPTDCTDLVGQVQ